MNAKVWSRGVINQTCRVGTQLLKRWQTHGTLLANATYIDCGIYHYVYTILYHYHLVGLSLHIIVY